MTVLQTSFCFICSHLASGQKEGNEFKRNFDVLEILRLTLFSRLSMRAGRRIPEKILEHDLKLNGMLAECLRGGTRGRYILPPHTSTPITRMLMLVRLQHQIKRGEHQHGVIGSCGVEMALHSYPTTAGSPNFQIIVLSVEPSLSSLRHSIERQGGAGLMLT